MRQNKRTVIVLIIFICLLMIITLAGSHRLRVRLRAGEERIRSLEKRTQQEQERTQEIAEEQEYMQSDEYIEQIAKDTLGLIRDEDIIFKESGKQ